MDIEALQAVLLDWVKIVTGLPARWENQAAPALQMKLPAVAILTGPINIESRGVDFVTWSDTAGGEVQPAVEGHREFDVMLRFVSRSQAGNKGAQFWLERVRAALTRPSSRETFYAAGLAVLSMSKGVQFDAPFEERFESIASATLRCTCAIFDAESAPETALTGVKITTTITGVDGSVLPAPLNVSDALTSTET